MAFLIIVMMVLVTVMMAVANRTLIIHRLHKLISHRFFTSFDRSQQGFCRKECGRSCYNRSFCIVLTNQRKSFRKLCIGSLIGMTEQNAACIRDLIVEKLAEILHIHFALININNSNRRIQDRVIKLCRYNCFGYVTKLTDPRRLDYYSRRSIVLGDLLQRNTEITYK